MTTEQTEEKKFEDIPGGVYVCSLKVKDIMVNKWGKRPDGSSYKTDELEPGFRLVFKVKDRQAYITKSFKKSAHEKGNCYKFAQDLNGSLLRDELEFNADGWCEESTLFNLLKQCDSKWFEVTCIKKDGKYLNLTKVKPIDAPAGGEVPPTPEPAESTDVDDDDIPF